MTITTFIATTGNGLARATRGPNDAWTLDPLLPGEQVRCLAADPLDAERLFAATDARGVLRSDDRGTTWRPVGLAGHHVRSLAVSATEPGTVFAGIRPVALYVSRDGGESWAELPALRRMRRWWWLSPAEWPPRPYVQQIALSPTEPGVMLAGIEAGAVLRSADGGRSWHGHLKGAVRDCHTLTFHPTDGDWAYEGGGGGASFSRDAGRTWTQPQRLSVRGMWMQLVGAGLKEDAGRAAGLDRFYGWAVGADPAQPNLWYFAAAPNPGQAHGHNGNAQAAIFRHNGNGAWRRLAGGLPDPLGDMPYALITDVGAPGHVYAGLSSGAIWHSPDYGDSWAQLPVTLPAIARTLIALR